MIRYLILILGVLLLNLSSCSVSEFIWPPDPQPKIPDTIVTSINPDNVEVQFVLTRNTYEIVAYWTDDNGAKLYEKSYEPYTDGRLHGIRKVWDKYGMPIHKSQWENGVRVHEWLDWYSNGELKRKTIFDKSGNKISEELFHENGNRKTDVVLYENGKLNTTVVHYDTTGLNPSEEYIYKNDELINVHIYRELYNKLDARVAELNLKIRQDSIRRAENGGIGPDNYGNTESVDARYLRSTDVDAPVW